MDKSSKWLWFGIICLVVVVLWSVSWWLVVDNLPKSDRGTFGDMFGAVNSLFSGLAFAGVIYSLIIQRHELKLQLDEIKRGADAHEDSVLAVKRQTQVSLILGELQATQSLLQNTQSVVSNLYRHTDRVDEKLARTLAKDHDQYLVDLKRLRRNIRDFKLDSD